MRLTKFVAGYLTLMLTAIAVIASTESMTPSEIKLKCQERQLWLLKAKAYEEAFMACSARYSRVLYNSELIAERCDEEVGRAQESRFTITHNLERIRANYKKALSEQGTSIKDRFKTIIEDVSNRGAAGLQVWKDRAISEEIRINSTRSRYHGLCVKVYIDPVVVDFKQLASWLQDEGFFVDVWDHESFAGSILWDR